MQLPSHLVLSALLLLSGCAHHAGSPDGSYAAYDAGLNMINPPVTLKVARSHRYRFCQAGRCVMDRWRLEEPPTNGGGRIAFQGRELEAFVIALARKEFGPDKTWEQRGVQGSIELDYGTGPLGQQITLGTGDAAFVKQ
jgi:hypothetical protein